MSPEAKWAVGGLLGVVALVALFASARAQTDLLHFGGLILFLAAVGAIFWMIRRHFDALEAAERAARSTEEAEAEAEEEPRRVRGDRAS